MITNVDGNLAALAKYEAEIDKQDKAWEYVYSKIEARLDELEDLVASIRAEAEEQTYDFSESINDEIQERLGL